MSDGERRPRLLCRCLGVASPRVYEAVRRLGLTEVAEVTKAVRAGGGCGMCHPEIEEIIDEVRGVPVDPMVALENRMVCRQETEARIAATVESVVRGRLAARGAAIELLEVDGLTVRVSVSGDDREAALAETRRLLRSYVCEDLDIEPA